MNMRIHYTLPASFEITVAEYGVVKAICNNSANSGGISKIMAIKFIKDQYKLSLSEAKNIVDSISRMNEIIPAQTAYNEKVARDYGKTGDFNNTLGGLLHRALDK